MPFRFIQVRKKRRHSIEATEILDRLERYIQDNEGKPLRLLVNHWKYQQDALSYREIRDMIKQGGLPSDLVREWTGDYSRFVIDKFAPVWKDSMVAGSHGQPAFDKVMQTFHFNPYRSDVKSWIDERGAAFIRDVTDQQQEAMRTMIKQYMYEKYSADELAKVIRPCVGLTDGQSRSVMRYYESLKENMREQHPRMKQSNLEEKCMNKALIYAERMHRDRAKMIAQTEMAFAYNHGMHESMRQAMKEGLIGTLEKRWITSGNENVCAECDALNGVQIGFDVPFDFGKHNHLFDGMEDCPPKHPRCCCVVQYIEVAPPVFENPVNDEEPDIFDTALRFDSGEEAEEYFGKHPDISLRRSDRERYDELRARYRESA